METPTSRKPFMDRFREYVADGFLTASALGSAYYLVTGGIQAVYENVPRLTCSTAVMSGVYTAVEHAMVSARGKEEPVLDSAVAIAVASGINALPNGVLCAGYSALIGGAMGAVLAAGSRLLEGRRGNQAQQAARDDPGLPVYTACPPTPPV